MAYYGFVTDFSGVFCVGLALADESTIYSLNFIEITSAEANPTIKINNIGEYMKLNITSQYAVRVMTYIAEDNKVLHNSKEISELLNIPYKSLARIITQLVAGNLVTSSRGREGGIRIEREYKEIKLVEILEAVKEEILDTSCILGIGRCNSEEKCALHDQWAEPKISMLKMFQDTTLEDMIQESKN